MTKSETNSDEVSSFISKLDMSIQPAVELLRKIILGADPEVSEHIKWNSPAFYYAGKMKEFDPKEYKRDILVMNLRNNRILCVLPTGMNIKKNTELLEGKYADGRRMMSFKDLGDIKSKESKIKATIREWLSLIEK